MCNSYSHYDLCTCKISIVLVYISVGFFVEQLSWLIFPFHLISTHQFLADRTTSSVIGFWHHNVVCPTVRPSVCQSVFNAHIVTFKIGVER